MSEDEDDVIGRLWQQHNSKVNTIIGKLTMARGIPIVKEAHQDLIDFAVWFDEEFMVKLDEEHQ